MRRRLALALGATCSATGPLRKRRSFAVAAAALNGTIGVFSKWIAAGGLPASSIAFYRSVIGFACLLVVVRQSFGTRAQLWRTAVCAFFGIFVLFFFETTAYRHDLAANVVLVLMGMAAVSAFVLGWIFIGDKPHPERWMGLAVCLTGLAFVLGAAAPGNVQGFVLAGVAGIGYGAFTVLAKSMQLGGGLAVTRGLLMFGAVYLAVPFVADGAVTPPSEPAVWAGLLALALLPSIGGFYCTTRAVALATPAQVQLFELSEPLFAAILAMWLLREQPTAHTYLGGALVVAGLFISQQTFRKKASAPA